MTCACGFDNEPAPGESYPEKCLGCGTPLRPAADHEKPAPGFDVYPEGDADERHPHSFGGHTVTDEDVERYPELEGVLHIAHCIIEWGRGIGAETYGYYTKKRVERVDLAEWNPKRASDYFDQSDPEYEPDHPDACPECGSGQAEHRTGFDGCVAGYDYLQCTACDHMIQEEFHC